MLIMLGFLCITTHSIRIPHSLCYKLLSCQNKDILIYSSSVLYV